MLFKAKRISGKLLLKRFVRLRGSDKHKRVDQELRKLRKVWWHFKSRWDGGGNE